MDSSNDSFKLPEDVVKFFSSLCKKSQIIFGNLDHGVSSQSSISLVYDEDDLESSTAIGCRSCRMFANKTSTPLGYYKRVLLRYRDDETINFSDTQLTSFFVHREGKYFHPPRD